MLFVPQVDISQETLILNRFLSETVCHFSSSNLLTSTFCLENYIKQLQTKFT